MPTEPMTPKLLAKHETRLAAALPLFMGDQVALCTALREAWERERLLVVAADAFVDAAEEHRLQLIVENWVTEKTKATYAKRREELGLATGALDASSLEKTND